MRRSEAEAADVAGQLARYVDSPLLTGIEVAFSASALFRDATFVEPGDLSPQAPLPQLERFAPVDPVGRYKGFARHGCSPGVGVRSAP